MKGPINDRRRFQPLAFPNWPVRPESRRGARRVKELGRQISPGRCASGRRAGMFGFVSQPQPVENRSMTPVEALTLALGVANLGLLC